MWFPNHITSVKDNWKIQCEFDYLSDKQNRISKNSPIFQWLGPFIWHHVKVSIKLAIKNYKFWTKWQCQTYAGTPIIYLLWLYLEETKNNFKKSVNLSIISLFIYFFIWLFVCFLASGLLVWLFVYPFIYLFLHLFICFFLCLSLYIYLFIPLFKVGIHHQAFTLIKTYKK